LNCHLGLFFRSFLSSRCANTSLRLLTKARNSYTFWLVLKINIPGSLYRENRRRRFEKFNSRSVCSVCNIASKTSQCFCNVQESSELFCLYVKFMYETPDVTKKVKVSGHKLAKLQHLLCLWKSQNRS